jgi:hypothetical protein
MTQVLIGVEYIPANRQIVFLQWKAEMERGLFGIYAQLCVDTPAMPDILIIAFI